MNECLNTSDDITLNLIIRVKQVNVLLKIIFLKVFIQKGILMARSLVHYLYQSDHHRQIILKSRTDVESMY